MRPELLPYKYRALKFIDEYKDGSVEQLGWKARKYIRWKEVHIDNDRALLKSFGDSAVDEGVLVKDSFPRINEILLNVQFWRLDRDNWSVEPEHTKGWRRARSLILSANDNPEIVSSYLNELNLQLDGLTVEEIREQFIKILLLEMVVDVRGLPKKLVQEVIDLSDVNESILSLVEKHPEAEELKVILGSDPLESFDLPNVTLKEDCNYQGFSGVPDKTTVVSYENLPSSKIFELIDGEYTNTVFLNSNHSLIKSFLSDQNTKNYFERFFRVYAETSEAHTNLSSQLDDFHGYLSLNLNREFKD